MIACSKNYVFKKSLYGIHFSKLMVPEAGLEPARYFYRGILSPLCLPIPPLGQVNRYQC